MSEQPMIPREDEVLPSVEPSTSDHFTRPPSMTVLPDDHFRPLSVDLRADSTIKPRRSRVHLTENDNVILIQICVTQSRLYQPRKLGKFWQLVGVLFSGQTGKSLKDPPRTVEELVAQRKITMKRQEMESGRLQEATELSSALDCWLEVVKGYDDMIEEKRLNQLEVQEQTKESERQVEELLLTVGRRRQRADAIEEEREGSPWDNSPRLSVSPMPTQRRKRSRPNVRDAEVAAVHGMTGALNNIAKAVGQTMEAVGQTMGSVVPMAERVTRLEERLLEQENASDRRHQELVGLLKEKR
ncbi:MAG: hypothetical protein M1823_002471 [Watsoniomyces obsoletus]|nr:MAG: hypothetical protein M1823_002471 [Watsoniomyces obsoletus]